MTKIIHNPISII